MSIPYEEPEFTPAVLKRAEEVVIGDIILAGERIQTVRNIEIYERKRIIMCVGGWMTWFENPDLVAVLPRPLVEMKGVME
jgi:hypothetical protein